MSEPQVRGKVVSATRIVDALGDALKRIKHEDGLTWEDVGAALGKSDDRAALYAAGQATMDVVAFYRAKQAWNGRFTGGADQLVEAHNEVDPHHAQSCILKAALALSVALEDGKVTVQEIQKNRSTLELARDAIDAQLARLTVRAA